jgi:hypothetical protein
MVKKRKEATNPAVKATTAYGFQFGGCSISTAAKATAQEMEAAKKHLVCHTILFK